MHRRRDSSADENAFGILAGHRRNDNNDVDGVNTETTDVSSQPQD